MPAPENDMPSDAAVEAAMAAVPAETWQRLFAAAEGFLADSERARWRGGEPARTADVGGRERPVFTMPWVDYSPSVRDVVDLLDAVRAVHPFDWPAWAGRDRYRSPGAIRSGPPADAARMATVIIRSDRFCEGSIAAAIADGTLAAIVERLLRWYDAERPGRTGLP